MVPVSIDFVYTLVRLEQLDLLGLSSLYRLCCLDRMLCEGKGCLSYETSTQAIFYMIYNMVSEKQDHVSRNSFLSYKN
jgi:hypothetical protein